MPLLDQGGEHDWTTGLFGCCEDVSGCIDSIMCYPCQFSRQCGALAGQAQTFELKWCIIPFLCSSFATCMICQMRARIRTKYEISGGAVGDCLSSFICPHCTFCMNGRELTNRGLWPGGSCCATSPPGGMG